MPVCENGRVMQIRLMLCIRGVQQLVMEVLPALDATMPSGETADSSRLPRIRCAHNEIDVGNERYLRTLSAISMGTT